MSSVHLSLLAPVHLTHWPRWDVWTKPSAFIYSSDSSEPFLGHRTPPPGQMSVSSTLLSHLSGASGGWRSSQKHESKKCARACVYVYMCMCEKVHTQYMFVYTVSVHCTCSCSARAWVTSCRLLSTWLQYEFIREGSCKSIYHFSSTSPILAENGDQPFLPGVITYFNVGHHLCVVHQLAVGHQLDDVNHFRVVYEHDALMLLIILLSSTAPFCHLSSFILPVSGYPLLSGRRTAC